MCVSRVLYGVHIWNTCLEVCCTHLGMGRGGLCLAKSVAIKQLVLLNASC